jgi:Protein of unknown function (DUF2442)
MVKNHTDFDQQVVRARAAGRKALKDPLRAIEAFYDESNAAFGFKLRNGSTVTLPVGEIKELRRVPKAVLRKISITLGGEAIAWEAIDMHISVYGLLHRAFSPALNAENGRLGGHAASAKKAAAARANGAKGGRPKTAVKA